MQDRQILILLLGLRMPYVAFSVTELITSPDSKRIQVSISLSANEASVSSTSGVLAEAEVQAIAGVAVIVSGEDG
ncbi:hypothetical protein KC336_g30 [Hortaea werneckii]|nr:hypothetical protein KC336_g30 [Hortaea werneckii]